MSTLRIAAAALGIALGASCMEPPKNPQMDDMVSGLAYLKEWDPHMHAKGQLTYDAVMGYGPDIFPFLVAHLTDDTPTAIYDEISQRNPKVSDVCFLILLDLLKMKWQDFSADGVFVSTALDNPVFCIKWDRVAKFKVQHRFKEILANQ